MIDWVRVISAAISYPTYPILSYPLKQNWNQSIDWFTIIHDNVLFSTVSHIKVSLPGRLPTTNTTGYSHAHFYLPNYLPRPSIAPHTNPNPNTNITSPLTITNHRIGDPIFALTIGTVSAAVRIRREQRDQAVQAGRDEKSIGFGGILETGGRRVRRWWNGEFRGL